MEYAGGVGEATLKCVHADLDGLGDRVCSHDGHRTDLQHVGVLQRHLAAGRVDVGGGVVGDVGVLVPAGDAVASGSFGVGGQELADVGSEVAFAEVTRLPVWMPAV